MLVVYQNGFAQYSTSRNYTVLRVEDCGAYRYTTITGECIYSATYFDTQPWGIRLLLESEDRIARNIEVSAEKKGTELPAENDTDLLGEVQADGLNQVIQQEQIREMLSVLTPKQRTYIYLHYWEGYQVQEIGNLFGTSTAAASMVLTAAKNKLKKKLEEET